jgi:hypothetical protein
MEFCPEQSDVNDRTPQKQKRILEHLLSSGGEL